jgi:pimeloyl-ACP methyl ester carboxylesterase
VARSMPGAGHFSPLEAPHAFADAIVALQAGRHSDASML